MKMRMGTGSSQRGALMIEVLVSIAIVVIGLWGLLEMQSRLQKSEMESYQRTQALILLNDMASRLTTNRNNAASYAIADPTTEYVGSGMTCAALTLPATRQQTDTREWCLALQGAAETQSGTSVGAMIGGRGCVEDLLNGQYRVTVVWQGLTPISAPPVNCGMSTPNAYLGAAGSECTGDLCRRYVTTIVRVAAL